MRLAILVNRRFDWVNSVAEEINRKSGDALVDVAQKGDRIFLVPCKDEPTRRAALESARLIRENVPGSIAISTDDRAFYIWPEMQGSAPLLLEDAWAAEGDAHDEVHDGSDNPFPFSMGFERPI